jgi:hypothetical protein
MRTFWEVKDEQEAEDKFAAEIGEKKHLRFLRLPRHYLLNYLIVDEDDRALGFADIRISNTPHHPAYAINLRTWETGIRLSLHLCHELTTKPVLFLVFVRFADGDKYYKFNEAERATGSVRWAGKQKSREPYPEPMVHIPINLFKNL